MAFKFIQAIQCLLLVCLFSQTVSAEELPTESSDASVIFKTAGVPPGFQFLLEKQTTAIDVFYGDVYITTTLASYTPTTVEFHNPDDVVSGLKNLITPSQVAKDLTGAIDSHAGEVCYRDAETDCGVIAPNTVGVIFDEGRFRADLFINPNLLSVQQIDFNRYLPASTSAFSNIHNLSLLYSGGDVGDSIATLGGQSLFSLGQQRVISSWDFGDVDGSTKFSMDTLYWQMDKADYQYQAGWFVSDTRFLSFAPSVNLLGLRYSTSFKARTDLDFAAGTPIQLYLPSRSRVNIFKDGKFVSTGFYNPGNQALDTSLLPDGAYDIELRIVDSSGREEPPITYYYVKTQRMAPFDQDLYFFEAGDIQTTTLTKSFPSSRNTPLLQGGYGHRLTKDLSLNVGGAATDSELLSELGLYYLRELFDMEPKVLLGSRGAYGWSLGGYARYEGWGSFYQHRRVWADNNAVSTGFELIPLSFKQFSFGINHELLGGNLQLRYAQSKRDTESSTEVVSMQYGKSFFMEANRFYFTAEVSKSDVDSLLMFTIDWSIFKGNTQHTVGASVLHQEDDINGGSSDLARMSYNGSWFDDDLRPEDISLQWNLQSDSDNTLLGLSNDIRNAYGSSTLGLSFNDGFAGSNYQYAGHLSTMVGAEGNEWGVGGKSLAEGALVIEVESDKPTELGYDLYINNVQYGRVYGGQKLMVPVTPYQTYNVRLSDKETEFVSFSDKNKRVTIYPGNVKSLKWQAKSIGVLIGRVVRKVPGCFNDNDAKCWDPLVFARAKNVNDFSATDADGYIQAEVFEAEKSFTLMKRGEECKVDFSKLEFTNGFAYSDADLRCYDIDDMDVDALQ
jgi:Mat/Ecp fimbriae outer membrane usher protein